MARKYDQAMVRRGSTLMVLLAFSLAACSSSSGDASPTTTPPVDSTPAPTTTVAPTTTNPPTTTATPTTTIDPATTLAAQVEADLLEAFRLGREAWQDPFDAMKEAAALDRRLGVVRSDLEVSLADYRRNNLALRPNELVPASVVVEGTPAFVGPNGEVAEVTVCEVNSWVLVEVGAGPGGADAIVDPDVVVTRSNVFMRDVDGIWKFEGGNQIGEWQGVEECPDV